MARQRHNTGLRRRAYDGRRAPRAHRLLRLRTRPHGRGGACGRSRPGRRFRRGGGHARAEAARHDALAGGTDRPVANAREVTGDARAPDRSGDSGGPDPVALPARRERAGGRAPARRARPAERAARGGAGLCERPLPPAARPEPAADRRAGALGARARERGRGDEDRDHRRGDRPDAPVLRAGGVHDAGRLPQGPDRLHEREGDRRPRLPAGRPDLEERLEAVRPGPLLARDARRRDRGREREHARARERASRASPRAPISATTRR